MPDFATKPLLKRKQIISRMTAFMNGAANIQGLWRGRLEWSFIRAGIETVNGVRGKGRDAAKRLT
jgi:hypothetical protein